MLCAVKLADSPRESNCGTTAGTHELAASAAQRMESTQATHSVMATLCELNVPGHFGRELCLLKEHAEGTYKTKHAEAARLYYTTKLLYYDI